MFNGINVHVNRVSVYLNIIQQRFLPKVILLPVLQRVCKILQGTEMFTTHKKFRLLLQRALEVQNATWASSKVTWKTPMPSG